MKNLLTNKELKVKDNWYGAEKLLKGYKSVVKVELTNTSSSAGDWDGYFIQKLNNRFYFIPFSQENNFPKMGFTLYTATLPYTEFDNIDDLPQIVKWYCEETY